MISESQLVQRVVLNYIDLGTAGLLIQLAIAGAVGGIYWLKTYWSQVKEFFKKKFKRG